MTTLTTASETETAPHPIHSNPVLPSDDRLVYSVAEVGDLLGISRAFAYELVARGELPVVRLGRRRLVPKIALLAMLGAGNDEENPFDGAGSTGSPAPTAA
jgi:excisionase family DNA binding protein